MQHPTAMTLSRLTGQVIQDDLRFRHLFEIPNQGAIIEAVVHGNE